MPANPGVPVFAAGFYTSSCALGSIGAYFGLVSRWQLWGVDLAHHHTFLWPAFWTAWPFRLWWQPRLQPRLQDISRIVFTAAFMGAGWGGEFD
jgi:hypothetical protein